MLHRNAMDGPLAEDGISEVVGFIFILAVVMAGLSLYLLYGVPVQGREVEIKEMDGVRAWFVDYKTSVDQLWLNSPTVPNNSTPYVPLDPSPVIDRLTLYSISTGQVTLRHVINAGTAREKGFISRYMPLLAPIPASAEVSVRTGDRFTISGWRNGTEVLNWNKTPPALVYTSHNNYWLQQEYYYQLGGVFLRQWDLTGGEPERVMVVQAPPLSIYPPDAGDTGYQTKAGMVVVNLSAKSGGFGATSPIRVETNLSADPIVIEARDKPQPDEFSNVSLTFEGSRQAAQAWSTIFNGTAARSGLNSNYYITSLSGTTARIDIVGYVRDDHETNPNIHDVQFEALVAEYHMRMENVPTLIE